MLHKIKREEEEDFSSMREQWCTESNGKREHTRVGRTQELTSPPKYEWMAITCITLIPHPFYHNSPCSYCGRPVKTLRTKYKLELLSEAQKNTLASCSKSTILLSGQHSPLPSLRTSSGAIEDLQKKNKTRWRKSCQKKIDGRKKRKGKHANENKKLVETKIYGKKHRAWAKS